METLAKNNSTQNDSPTGEFLQSQLWRQFQESVGRKTFHLEGENFWANIIEHKLPLVGKYFYVPRGPILKISNFNPPAGGQDQNSNDQIPKQIQMLNQVQHDIDGLMKLAKENGAGWIRIEPETEEILEIIRKNTKHKIVKAPHDVQPRETFVIDIAKSEEALLAEMKPKTRYNIRLAEKKKVLVRVISNYSNYLISNQTLNPNSQTTNQKYIAEFLRLTVVMAKRNGITAHLENYYRKMLENISGDILKLYVAEYEGKIIAANLVIFYGNTCTYLHGASDDDFRNVMAPYLLQWRQILDAKKVGCRRYDFGGIKTVSNESAYTKASAGKQETVNNKNSWGGITKFKLGFSPKTFPTVRPGSYDIAINLGKYRLYKTLQRLKQFFGK